MCFRKSSASSANPSSSQKATSGSTIPELGQVAGGVGVFRPEGRPEGVDVGQGHGEDFGFQLAADSQEGGASEKVFGGINRSLAPRRVVQVQGGDAEHGTRALGVAGGDDGRLDVLEAAFLEEGVYGEGGERCGRGPWRRRCWWRGRRWAISRRNSGVCRFFCKG